NYQSHFDRGKAALEAGNADLAIKELSDAIAAKPEASAYQSRGEAYAAKGSHAEAIKDYYEALDRNQEDSLTWALLGVSETAQQEYTVAENAFAISLRLDMSNVKAYYGRAMLSKAQGKKEEATADFNRVLERTKDKKLIAQVTAQLT